VAAVVDVTGVVIDFTVARALAVHCRTLSCRRVTGRNGGSVLGATLLAAFSAGDFLVCAMATG
jgi:hypothetical protein